MLTETSVLLGEPAGLRAPLVQCGFLLLPFFVCALESVAASCSALKKMVGFSLVLAVLT